MAAAEDAKPATREKNTAPQDSPAPATSATTDDTPDFGWSAYAERVNGRFAMVGLTAILVIELLTHDSFLVWLGWLW
ncbi:MAG: high light inducible protein [Aphanocapsa feldmannii 277cV]|uniref:High light inducible protein n=2 Tax=Aphanocapsa feldmannii TaxID=192050 RepID=A0A524RQP2_9CHRO|nr:MAG: high light inducible protein [Aphanocapsa feldmannii 277cV]TGH20263.1 MAG: high light inducible protein [Aphanocapsa feldmannii 277cI]